MNREEILEKSRIENKNQDIYEQEILKQCNTYTLIVVAVLSALFCMVQIFAGGGINYGFWALVFTIHMMDSWVKYVKLKQRKAVVTAILYTIIVFMFSISHIYTLVSSSIIL